MMNDMMYRHVLFKDLSSYVKRTDYFAGYTEAEKRFIRTNLGIDYLNLKDNESVSIEEITYSQLKKLIDNNLLISGKTYAIIDFKTIYKSNEINSNGIHVTYGKDINQSLIYTLITKAINYNTLDPRVIILSSDINSILWNVKYNPELDELEDGTFTQGTIIYLQDENENSANYDFKNIIHKNGYTFKNELGKENSKNCKNNKILGTNISLTSSSNNNELNGNNILINISINNLHGILNNVIINKDEINLGDNNLKQCVQINNKLYIEYLDYETLTHQLYEL